MRLSTTTALVLGLVPWISGERVHPGRAGEGDVLSPWRGTSCTVAEKGKNVCAPHSSIDAREFRVLRCDGKSWVERPQHLPSCYITGFEQGPCDWDEFYNTDGRCESLNNPELDVLASSFHTRLDQYKHVDDYFIHWIKFQDASADTTVNKPADQDESKRCPNTHATRCIPGGGGVLQAFNGTKWIGFDICGTGETCIDHSGQAACVGLNGAPIIKCPKDLSGGHLSRGHRTRQSEPDTPSASDLPPLDWPKDNKWNHHYTRCKPSLDPFEIEIEVLPGQYRHWYTCDLFGSASRCIDFEGHGACYLGDGHIHIPTSSEPIGVDQTIASVNILGKTKCHNRKEARTWNGKYWATMGTCPGSLQCVDVHEDGGGYALCMERGLWNNSVMLPQPIANTGVSRATLQSRDAPESPDFDTRCDPHNVMEVQKFQDNKWQLHYRCEHYGPDSRCFDLKGTGACFLADNHWHVPAANSSTSPEGPPSQVPAIGKKRCNEVNPAEAIAWNGFGWAHVGFCPAPKICHDFVEGSETSGITLCLEKEKLDDVTFPWDPKTLAPQHVLKQGDKYSGVMEVLDEISQARFIKPFASSWSWERWASALVDRDTNSTDRTRRSISTEWDNGAKFGGMHERRLYKKSNSAPPSTETGADKNTEGDAIADVSNHLSYHSDKPCDADNVGEISCGADYNIKRCTTAGTWESVAECQEGCFSIGDEDESWAVCTENMKRNGK
jgi:hypothetical protein